MTNTVQRDELEDLADLVASRRGVTAKTNDTDRRVARDIQHAGYTRLWIITDVDTLDDLPKDTLIISEQGGLFERVLVGDRGWLWDTGLFWREVNTRRLMASTDIALPAMVIPTFMTQTDG